MVLTGAATVVGSAAMIALTARAQDAPAVKYYQGKVSPPQPGTMLPATYVRTDGGTPDLVPGPGPVFGNTGPAFGPGGPAGAAARAGFTTPVVAGPNGVQPIPVFPPGTIPPPSIPSFAESVASDGGVPPATPPGLGRPPAFVPTPSAADAASSSGVVPAGATTPAPPAPTVTVERYPTDAKPNSLPDPKPLSAAFPRTGEFPPAKPGDLPPVPVPDNVPAARSVAVPPPAAPVPASTEGAAAQFKTETAPPQPAPPTQPAPLAQPISPAQPAPLPQQVQSSGPPLPARQAPTVIVEVEAPKSIGVGQPLAYELVVRNTGTTGVMNLRIEDELPMKATFVSSEPPAETSGDRLAWSLGALDAGTEKRIKITVKPSEEGEIRSRAVVSFASAVDARVTITRPKIALVLTAPDVARVGEKVPFQIKLSNTGSGLATRVTLQAKFSDGLSHAQGQTIETVLADVPAGQTKTFDLPGVAASRSGAQTCTITAIADGNPAEIARAAVTLVEPMLQIKQTGPARCHVKNEPVYQIELANPGTAATDPVSVWATLPPGFEFVSADSGGGFSDASHSVGWRLPALPPGSTKVVALKVRAAAPTEGVIRTVAQTAGTATEVAENAGGGVARVDLKTTTTKGLEARAESPVKAEGVPAIRFEVADLEDPVEVGKEALYEIRVMNQGTGPCTNVRVVAELADGTVAVGATGQTSGRVNGQQLEFDPIPMFAVKAEAMYRIRVKGTVPGDFRFRVRLVYDQIKTPIVKEENTKFVKE
ncbi:DNA polymerase III subunits gamma and tau [Fimbriiglobus ruber]|uniref:DNA polymerase III subunits gamma and tau n=1 Tax=Fimbriiglobus ruber TaxID=1908690 RepID=A0A225DPT8_9BACT|nr:DNA polymerase III subunits gamma and tau [Fimbriiglobus ruber]